MCDTCFPEVLEQWGLPISDLDMYLLYALGVYTLGVYSFKLPTSDLELHLPCVRVLNTVGV